MLGHSDIRTTQIYAKMQDKTIYEDMATMRNKFDCAMMNWQQTVRKKNNGNRAIGLAAVIISVEFGSVVGLQEDFYIFLGI